MIIRQDNGIKRTELIQGIPVYYYGRIVSTMDTAEDLLKKGKTGIVVAEEQSKGRGRYGREWFSLPGGLYFSLILQEQEIFNLSEILSISIINTLQDLGISCRIKMPNDIITEGKKIAGILIIKKKDAYIAGIGINVNNETGDAPERISVSRVLNLEIEIDDVLEQFVKNFLICKERFAADLQTSLKEWSKNLLK